MAKHLPDEDRLDKKSRERLEKLESQWSESCDAMFLKELKLPDLKLLLEHFTPLQDLIRALVATPVAASPGALAHETASLRDQASAAQTDSDSGNSDFDADCPSCHAHFAQAVIDADSPMLPVSQVRAAMAYRAFLPTPPPSSLFRPPLVDLA